MSQRIKAKSPLAYTSNIITLYFKLQTDLHVQMSLNFDALLFGGKVASLVCLLPLFPDQVA